MDRARIIFILLSVYIFAAFAWWTYAHYSNTQKIFTQKKDLLEMSCYKATFDLQGAVSQEMFNDSIDMQKFFAANYPELDLLFLDNFMPLDNFMVRPSIESYKKIEADLNRKLTMYITEGLVMMLLLFWGMVYIYKSFKKELFLKKLQNNFLLSVTHELKTPLTAMKLYMETLLKRTIHPEQIQTIAENSLNETKRLQEQVEKLLLSAQLDSKKYELDIQDVNVSELVTEHISHYNLPREEKDRIFTEIEEQLIVKADASAIEMILNNLLSNAEKYGGEHGKIKVVLKSNQNQIILQVIDEGSGISDTDKRMLFNKFYRVGDEQTRKTKGTGLGLFIAKHLVHLHKGKISVSDNQPKGTVFEIKLESNAN
ncbi:MAG: HAMP domain-containing histidine kinase [Sphingobacteriales bacterium]|jgi:signal transduction histidine kinase|nr:HAMP domain-containing histidine kinase [Sphingobacteriales bacterium]